MSKNNGGHAFPVPAETGMDYAGMSLRDYFIAHAPAEPQPWFQPVMATERPKPVFDDEAARIEDDPFNFQEIKAWEVEKKKQRYVQWPAAWADEQLKLREQE